MDQQEVVLPDMRRCARCGASLTDADPAKPRPACLLALAVDIAEAPDGAVALAAVAEAPVRIGPYRILETLGEGGMGVVYLAEQDVPLRRRVAIKVIKLGIVSGCSMAVPWPSPPWETVTYVREVGVLRREMRVVEIEFRR